MPEGFKHDFPHLISRRAMLGGLASSAATPLFANCVPEAQETAGPFPADGSQGRRSFNVLAESGVLRRDIRASFAGLSGEAQGAELDLEIALVNTRGDCRPVLGHAIYIWHCDAVGAYSLYEVEGQNYLRGVAVTDTNGIARFTTIFPGCYASRWPHIHFEVFASLDDMMTGHDSLLIGQTSFIEADCAQVYAGDQSYRVSRRNLPRNDPATDIIFRDDSAAKMEQRTVKLTSDAPLSGQVVIGL